MVKAWNEDAATFFGPELDKKQLSWMGCLSHGLSNCGTAMRKSAVVAKAFFSAFKKMSTTSHAARGHWKRMTGVACPILCDNRWWCWYDCAAVVYSQWEKVPGFVRYLSEQKIAEKSAKKMLGILDGFDNMWLTLELQLRILLAFGKQFRDAGTLLEGDGFVLPYVSSTLRASRDLMEAVSHEKERHALFADLHRRCREYGLITGAADFAVTKLVPIVLAGMDKFRHSIWAKLGDHFALYDAAALFHPMEFLHNGSEGMASVLGKACEALSCIKGLPRQSSDIRLKLVMELEVYKKAASKFRDAFLAKPEDHDPHTLWEWWKAQRVLLPAWFEVACKLVLIMPSSAVVERFFSVIKSQTSEQQGSEYEATFVGRCKALFNK